MYATYLCPVHYTQRGYAETCAGCHLIVHKTAEEDCSSQRGGVEHVEHIVKAALAL